jgi:dTDP-4-dehydrorhamnose reductase
MRTVVFGSPGQLGRDLTPRLKGEVIPLSRADVDLTSPEKVRAKLEELKPTHVVNCAAYNFVDKAETEPEVAFASNTWALRSLAQACRDLDLVLTHFSTDYVYGLPGLNDSPLSETAAPGPVSVYGLSKLAGEYQVRSICPKHFVIRTCGLYGVWGSGGKGGNFVETMLRVAGQGKPLKVVHDQRCTPSFTVDVATAAAQLVETQAYGLYHVTNADDCSWYEFAREIFAVAGVPADLSPITSAQFNAPAPRPPYSVLSNEKLVSVGVERPRSWKEAIRQYLKDRGQRN